MINEQKTISQVDLDKKGRETVIVRGNFELELQEIKKNVLDIGQEVKNSFQLVISALEKRENEPLLKVINYDPTINRLEMDIHEQVTLVIAKQQPVATDLRKLLVALKMSTDLERVGDLSVDIAKAARRILGAQLNGIEKLFQMAELVHMMLEQAFIAYEKSDVLYAQKIAIADDSVDALLKEFFKEMFTLQANAENIEVTTQLALIGRCIERIGDYATNLAEQVVYEVNGYYVDLN